MALCSDVEALLAQIAGGEPLPEEVRDHLGVCPSCASALAQAQRIERLLQAREAPPAPAGFTAAVLAAVSRERWRSEQVLDWGFNIAVAAGVALMIGGIWLLLNASGLTALTSDAAGALGASSELFVSQFRMALPTYGSALLLVVATLGVWWWADRRMSP